jgi:hypothetical protein
MKNEFRRKTRLVDRAPRNTPHRVTVGVELLQTVLSDLLALVLHPRREIKPLNRRVATVLLHEAVDANKKRQPLLQAVESGTHRYRTRAAKAA